MLSCSQTPLSVSPPSSPWPPLYEPELGDPSRGPDLSHYPRSGTTGVRGANADAEKGKVANRASAPPGPEVLSPDRMPRAAKSRSMNEVEKVGLFPPARSRSYTWNHDYCWHQIWQSGDPPEPAPSEVFEASFPRSTNKTGKLYSGKLYTLEK